MKKGFKILLIAICLSVLFTGCVKNGENKTENKKTEEKASTEETKTTGKIEDEPMYGKEILIGYNGGLCTGTPGIAAVNKEFEKEGLKVKVINVQSGLDAVGTNKVQVFSDHLATVLVPSINGINVQLVAGAQTGCKSLYVLNDDKINKTSDLLGKTIAVPDGIGNSDHNIALRFLEHDKVDAKQIKFKPVETSAVIQALEKGEIQATLLSDQFAEKFVNEGKIKSIRSLTTDPDFQKEPCCVHVLNADFIRDNPQTAKKVVTAIMRTKHWVEDNKEEATKILFDNHWASGDFDQALRMMKTYDFKISQKDTKAAIRSTIDDYKKFGLVSNEKSTDDLMKKFWNPVGVDESVVK